MGSGAVTGGQALRGRVVLFDDDLTFFQAFGNNDIISVRFADRDFAFGGFAIGEFDVHALAAVIGMSEIISGDDEGLI